MANKRIWADCSYTDPTYSDVRPTWGREGEDWDEYVHIDEYTRVVKALEQAHAARGLGIQTAILSEAVSSESVTFTANCACGKPMTMVYGGPPASCGVCGAHLEMDPMGVRVVIPLPGVGRGE